MSGANPKGELTTSIIQPSSQTEQMPVVGLSLRRRHLRGWEPEVRFFLVLVGLTDCVAEINLSGILTENDIIVRCGEGRLFTRWPPFVHIFYGFVHILCGHHICAVLYNLWPALRDRGQCHNLTLGGHWMDCTVGGL